jgi:hypothetical protein
MQIIFRNRFEDIEAGYDYILTQTKEGKLLSRQAYGNKQKWAILVMAFFSALLGGAGGDWRLGVGIAAFCFLIGEAAIFIESGFKPRYYYGKRALRQGDKHSLIKRDRDIFILPKTITTNDDWLEIINSEVSHRYRWRIIDSVALTDDFIFVHVDIFPSIYIPKRDFPSEEAFLEFGKHMLQLQEKAKNQPIGNE